MGDVEYKQDTSLDPRKQMITAFPETKIVDRTKDIEFLILACDGIWDCMSSQEACDFVSGQISQNKSGDLSGIIGNMFDKNIAEEIHLSSKFSFLF